MTVRRERSQKSSCITMFNGNANDVARGTPFVPMKRPPNA